MAGEVTNQRLTDLKTGIQNAINKVDQLIKLEAYAEKLPIIGDRLTANTQAIDTLTRLRDALNDAVNAVQTAGNLANMSTTNVANALNAELQRFMTQLNSTYGHIGTATAIVHPDGSIEIGIDSGRVINLPFTLADLGMSGLGLNLRGDANAQVSYNLDFRIGIDGQGFWLDTNQTNLSLGAKLDLNDLGVGYNVGMGGSLGSLNFKVTNIQDNDPAVDADTLNFNIGTTWNLPANANGILRSFTADIADFRATGNVDLDLHLAADMGTAALPRISADLHVDWDFNQAILLNGSGTNSWSSAGVSFTNVNYDFGSFITLYVTPLLKQLTPYLKPINEALAIFNTDISGLLLPKIANELDVMGASGLGKDGKVTMIDLLQYMSIKFNKNIDLTNLQALIGTLERVVDFANYFSGKTYSNDGYPIGNWQGVLTDVQGAVTALSGVDVNNTGFTNGAPGATTTQAIENFIGSLSSAAQGVFQITHQGAVSRDSNGTQLLVSLIGDPLLRFPLIENPSSVIDLLKGKDIDLFKLDLPVVNISLGMDNGGSITTPLNIATIPIWGAPVIAVKLNAAAQVLIDLAAGYDTRGLRLYATDPAGAFSDPTKVFNGFYLDDQRSGGIDKAEVTIRAAIELALDLNAGVIGAGAAGGLFGEVFLNLNDALTGSDSKLYYDEILNAPGFPANPFAIFDVSGRISAGLRAYVYSGPFTWVNWNSPRVTLVNFGGQQGAGAVSQTDPGLASVGNDASLFLHSGQNAGLRLISDKTDRAETFEVSQLNDGRLRVSAFNATWFYSGATTIQGDGGAGNDDLILDASVTLNARLSGGLGADYLVGGAGADDLQGNEGSDYLRGQAGIDKLYGNDGDDFLEGGAGADQLFGGAGTDTATYAEAAAAVTLDFSTGVHGGDAANDTFDSIERFDGSKHNDTMIGSSARDIFSGAGGNDTLSGGGGDDILAGGAGTNTIDGGAGYDIIDYRNAPAITVTMTGFAGTATGGSGDTAFTDTLSGAEQIEGSTFADTMTGGTGRQIFVGNEGNDVLSGGDNDDLLIGGEDRDTLDGGDGNDTASYEFAAAGVTLNLATGGTGGEALGDTFTSIENVYGSQYNDTVVGDTANNLIEGNDGNDTLSGAAGDDILVGGIGTDTLNGDAGRDILRGGADNDTLNGGDDDDTLLGGAGGDALNGGAGFDFASYRDATAAITLDRIAGTGTGDAANDTFSNIEGYEGSDFNDTIRATSNSAATVTASVTLTSDNQNNAGTGTADNDIGVNGNWTAANPIEFDLVVAGTPAVLSATLTIVATGIDPASNTAYAERDEVWVNNMFVGVLASGASSTTTLAIDPLLLTAGANRVVIRNVNPAAHGSYTFGVTSASLSYTTAAGLEEIRGGIGNDTLYGGGGIDRIYGGTGDDTIDGEGDADVIFGDAGVDFLYGGDGNDVIDGGADNDVINGGAGADRVHGGGGVDQVYGNDGDDILHGDAGDDEIHGGIGADTIVADSGNDSIDGGADRDIVDYVAAPGGVRVNLSGASRLLGGQTVAGLTALDGYGTTDSFLAVGGLSTIEDARGTAFEDHMAASEGGSQLWGMDGDDTLVGNGGDDTLRGGDGIDTIIGGGGNDTIQGGAGADLLAGESGTSDWASYEDDAGAVTASLQTRSATDGWGSFDQIVGFENLRGSAYGDTLTGDDGANVIEGLGGNDVIDGGFGGDTMRGGAGDDIIYVDRIGANGDSVSDTSGNDLVRTSVDMGSVAAPFGLWSDVEDVQLLTGATIAFGNASNNGMMGNAAANWLDGLAGGDTFWGYAGDDTYVFDSLSDTIGTVTANRALTTGAGEVAGGGNDTIRLATANIYGGTFQNQTLWTYDLNRADLLQVENVILTDDIRRVDLVGNELGNRLIGNAHGSIIRGEGGDDFLGTGTAGADDIRGGSGLDTLIIDWSSNGNGKRTYTAPTANTTLGGWNGEYDTPSGGGYVYYTSIERFEITTGSGGDDIITADGDDIVILNAGNDFVNIGSGFDRADGGADRDGISANYGTDALAIRWDLTANTYSEGDDGTANDKRAFTNFEYFGTLTTGSGNDVIVTKTGVNNETINTGLGNDRITVFEGGDTVNAGIGLDTLVIDWSANDNGKRTYNDPAANTTLGGWNGAYDTPSGGGYVYYTSIERFEITTGNGGDSIMTADGDDIVTLNGGDDFVNVGSGLDRADGGTGRDGISANYGTDTLAINWDLTANTYSEGIDGVANDRRAFSNFEYFGTLTTGSGDDVIVTKTGVNNETINTGLGNDRITVFEGGDTVNAGAGFDTLVIDWSANNNGKRTYNDPAANATLGGWNGQYDTPSGGGSVTYTSIERFEITTGDGGDSIMTADGNDIVTLNGGDDFVNVGSGLDRADGGTGRDGISANYSTDTLAINWDLTANTYSEGADGVANDTRVFSNFEYFGTLTTGSGNDVIVTTTTDAGERITTGAGDDRIAVFAGGDIVNAGAGFDTLVIDWSANGNGKRTYSGPVLNTTPAGGWNGYFDTPSGGGSVEYTSIERFEITTGSGNDDITTADGDDFVFLNAGDDFVNVGSGLDRANGGAGRDGISANYATETLAINWNLTANTYSEGTDGVANDRRVFSNFEYFGTLTTGSGNDVIVTTTTGAGETINTGAGNDRISIFEGGDTVNGGAGTDTLVIDWSANGNGKRTYSAPVANATLGGWNGYYDTPSGGAAVSYTSIENFEITTGSGGDDITTADGNDIVVLNAGNDFVNVGSGLDRADGGADSDGISANYAAETLAINWNLTANTYSEGTDGTANDKRAFTNFEYFGTLTTGSGNDVIVTTRIGASETINAGAGNDRITVFEGGDTVNGGAGTDTLVIDWSANNNGKRTYSGPVANTTAGGWNGYYDTPSGGGAVSYTSIERFEITTGNSGDEIFTADGDDILVLNGGNDRGVTGAGNDFLDGGSGDDTLIGGAGDDTYVVDSAGDVVTENANEGNDTIRTTLATYSLAGLANVENLTGISLTVAHTLTGNAAANRITGGALGDTLNGGAGDDTLVGGLGNDTLEGGDGIDVAVFSGLHASYRINRSGDGTVTVTGADGTDTLRGVERFQFSDGVYMLPTNAFVAPTLAYDSFGQSASAGGWTNATSYPRTMADVNGDGRADVIGFGDDGTFVSVATAGGGFNSVRMALDGFGKSLIGGGWINNTFYPRTMADVNGDGFADILGFGDDATYVALANGTGGFLPTKLALAGFGKSQIGGGWTDNVSYPRMIGDVNGDGKADLIGFGDDAVFVALGNGNGTFQSFLVGLNGLGKSAAGGGWTSNEIFPRMVADINGDGRGDLVAFGDDAVFVAYADGTGRFAAPTAVYNGFGRAAGGWTGNDAMPRMAADVNGDGKADLIGFGKDGVHVALNKGNGTFSPETLTLAAFGADASAGNWTSNDLFPRMVADINGDGVADIIGFGPNGIVVAPAVQLVPVP